MKRLFPIFSVREDNEPDPISDNGPLQECHICSRKFIPDTFIKHIQICEKMASKKRKPFDSSLQRREGTDLANFIPLPDHYNLPKTKLNTSTDDRITVPVRVVNTLLFRHFLSVSSCTSFYNLIENSHDRWIYFWNVIIMIIPKYYIENLTNIQFCFLI